MFNRSKCENCFKDRESHLLTDDDCKQAKPVHGGWLLLAPEGPNFDNPTRKWQRRFFILYEQGLLCYALDDMPSTLPPNMNQCGAVLNGETRTNHSHTLCLQTPDHEYIIRAENKEVLYGWQEALMMYQQSGKQTQKRKHLRETPSSMEVPTQPILREPVNGHLELPATGTHSVIHSDEEQDSKEEKEVQGKGMMRRRGASVHKSCCRKLTCSRTEGVAAQKQEPCPTSQALNRYSNVAPQSTKSLPEVLECVRCSGVERGTSLEQTGHAGGGRDYTILADVPRGKRLNHRQAFQAQKQQFQARARSPGREEVVRLFGLERSRSLVIDKFEALEGNNSRHVDFSSPSERSNRQKRHICRLKPEQAVEGTAEASTSDGFQSQHAPRRAKTQDRRVTESPATPDLLHFKKGWLTRLDDNRIWKKHWFVLSELELRYYIDCLAEEAGDVDGVMELSTCSEVTEFPVVRNYGFQIHTRDCTFTLCAMTTGIRRGWIEALRKNVQPSSAPDVTRTLPGEKSCFRPAIMTSPKHRMEPDVELQQEEPSRSRVQQEGRYITSDCCEFYQNTCQEEYAEDTVTPCCSSASSTLCISVSLPTESLADTVVEEQTNGQSTCIKPCNSQPLNPHLTPSTEAFAERQIKLDLVSCPQMLDSNSSPQLPVELELSQQQTEATPREMEYESSFSTSTDPASTSAPPAFQVTQLEQIQPQLQHREVQVAVLPEQQVREGFVLQSDSVVGGLGSWWQLHSLSQETQREVLSSPHTQIIEQAVARLRSELKLEQQRFREAREKWECIERALQAQVHDSEARLKVTEAYLLEKNQALRDLERHQALQRDHRLEVQRLQEKLSQVMARLLATDEAQALREERLQKNLDVMMESQEKERHCLAESLVEAQAKMHELEERLLEAEQQPPALLENEAPSIPEGSHRDQQLEDTVEKLSDLVRRLEDEKHQLELRCRELANQMSESDGEVNKLRLRLEAQETGYYNLEHSCEKMSEELQQVNQTLQEKEEEMQKIKEQYDQLVVKREQKLNEAVVKMEALGSSLEEAELKLQKKDLSCIGCGGVHGHVDSYYSELECCMKDLQASYAELQEKHAKLQEDYLGLQKHAQNVDMTLSMATNCITPAHSDSQKEKVMNNIEQQHLKKDDMKQSSKVSDAEKFISVIHAHEANLFATEEKLKDITFKLGHFGNSREKTKLLFRAKDIGSAVAQEAVSYIEAVNALLWKVLVCLEGSRQKALTILKSHDHSHDPQLHIVSEMETELAAAAACIRDCVDETKFENYSVEENITMDDNKGNLFAKTLAVEAMLLRKMANAVRKEGGHLWKSLDEVHQEAEKLNSKDPKVLLTPLFVDAVARRLVLESKFWVEVEKYQKHLNISRDACQDYKDVTWQKDNFIIDSSCIRAEITYASLNLKMFYEEKLQRLQEDLQTALAKLQPREYNNNEKQIRNNDRHTTPKKVLDNHFQEDVIIPQTSITVSESERFAAELEGQADVLQHISEEMFVVPEVEMTNIHYRLAEVFQWNVCSITTENSRSLCLREAINQAHIAYVACCLRAEHHQKTGLIIEELHVKHAQEVDALNKTLSVLQQENEALQVELSNQKKILVQAEEQFQHEAEELLAQKQLVLRQVEQQRAAVELALLETTADCQHRLEVVLLDMEKVEERHEAQMQNLEDGFQERFMELQSIHEQEMEKLHGYYSQTVKVMQETLDGLKAHFATEEALVQSLPTTSVEENMDGIEAVALMRERIQELEVQVNTLKEEGGKLTPSLKLKHQQDLESIKATYEKGCLAMEEMHRRLIEDLQRQHQHEIAKLLEERECLLAEETAATIAAIEAMKKGHREELQKAQQIQLSGVSSDITDMRRQYEEELHSMQRELEVLSEQYSQKCLESAHLGQALEAERLALCHCQQESQELNTRNLELNSQLKEELFRIRTRFIGEVLASDSTQTTEFYELQVLLRVKESEIQCLKQEAHSLREEMQSVQRDKKQAVEKHMDLYRELSIVNARADLDISRLREQLCAATETDGSQNCDVMKSKISLDFHKEQQTAVVRHGRGMRSKSLKEGLTVQECMYLLQPLESRKGQAESGKS